VSLDQAGQNLHWILARVLFEFFLKKETSNHALELAEPGHALCGQTPFCKKPTETRM